MESQLEEVERLTQVLLATSNTPSSRVIADLCRRNAAATEVVGQLCNEVIGLQGEVRRIGRKVDVVMQILATQYGLQLEEVVPESLFSDFKEKK